MIALISPAKTMRHEPVSIPSSVVCSRPRFGDSTNHIVSLMLNYSVEELKIIFKISEQIAQELKSRFVSFFDEPVAAVAALDSYDGVVYKHFKGEDMLSPTFVEYLQKHLRISSLLYGLLRPMDVVKPYRMEGFVRLAGSDERVDRYWRDVQTQTLIDDVNSCGGVLLYLASKEEQNAFHWKQVCSSVRVIDFQFLQHKGDKLRQVVIYTKMARGQMVKYMAENNIEDVEELKNFEWGGYRYNSDLSTPDVWVWVMD